MFSSRHISPTSRQPDYFSIAPTTAFEPSSASTVETPLLTPECHSIDAPVADPSNPFLAIRPVPTSPYSLRTKPRMDASKLLQLQTQASHQPTRSRPQPQPVQNVLVVSGSADYFAQQPPSTTGSDDSSSSGRSSNPVARCSRCHRTPSLDLTTGKGNMVSYGLNLYYCTRCAGIVGFRSR